jgi:hypothetical protein
MREGVWGSREEDGIIGEDRGKRKGGKGRQGRVQEGTQLVRRTF